MISEVHLVNVTSDAVRTRYFEACLGLLVKGRLDAPQELNGLGNGCVGPGLNLGKNEIVAQPDEIEVMLSLNITEMQYNALFVAAETGE